MEAIVRVLGCISPFTDHFELAPPRFECHRDWFASRGYDLDTVLRCAFLPTACAIVFYKGRIRHYDDREDIESVRNHRGEIMQELHVDGATLVIFQDDNNKSHHLEATLEKL